MKQFVNQNNGRFVNRNDGRYVNRNEIYPLLRENIKALAPYSTARDDCKTLMDIYLDANESPYGNEVNRYPSPSQDELKKRLSVLKKISADNIFLGNGSDEPIDLILRLFCSPGESSILQIVPTYGMYSVAAGINDVRVINVPLGEDFSLDADSLLEKVEADTKVIFLCSPNNPTGNLLDNNEIGKILDGFDGIVVVDEAYIDFASSESFIHRIAEYPRLIVLQTLSKAWAMAGLRIGMAFADPYLIYVLSMVKYPYNINVLSQKKAMELLENPIAACERVEETVAERERLAAALEKMPDVQRVYPSDANFLLVRFSDKTEVFERLIAKGIIVRDRSSAVNCDGCLRITVGTPRENDVLISVLYEGPGAEKVSRTSRTVPSGLTLPPASETLREMSSQRVAEVFRKTKETVISVKADLDTFRTPRIATGLNFFNHMLEQIAYHSGIALDVIAFGDLGTDDHHTVEDVAIALGDCLYQALGDKKQIDRYGFCLPMDEADAYVVMDLGGRTDFAWSVSFTSERTGDVSTQMFSHFFKSLAEHLKCNLHISATGQNDHHIIEGIFKAFARALKMAVRKEKGGIAVPSSKGAI